MASPLPPDPYAALGVPQDATASTIKTTYRKLALKCHPDKVTDESQKARAADQFHRIQQAYEIIGDDDKRSRYDAQVKLAELRREKLENFGGSGSRVDIRTPAHDGWRSGPGAATFSTRGPVYEEWRPSKSYDSDHGYFDESRASARKYDGYERRPSVRVETRSEEPARNLVRERASARESERADRSERRKARDRDTRKGREDKYSRPYVEDDDSDERSRYEDELYRRRNDEARARERYEEEGRRQRSRQEDDYADVRQQKIYTQQYLARDYQERSNAETRPSPSRTTSNGGSYDVRRVAERPAEMIRRSSARPRATERVSGPPRPRSSGKDRERKGSLPEIVEYAPERKLPPLQSSMSSPANIRTLPRERSSQARSQTMQPDYDRSEPLPHPTMRRSETMPVKSSSSSRRSATLPKLRQPETNDSGYSSAGTPEYGASANRTPTSSSRYYNYGPGPEVYDTTRGYKTVVMEPDHAITRSPSPTSRSERPSLGTPRASSSRYPATLARSTSSYASQPPSTSRPTLARGTSSSVRTASLYGEIPRAVRYPEEDVLFQRRFTPDDIKYASGYSSRRHAEDYRPSMGRSATFSYAGAQPVQ
ncbi:hypothetical protein BJ546DRAFT_158235 [Cryomyces antarcticus]